LQKDQKGLLGVDIQGGNDLLDRKRAVYLLHSLGSADECPALATLLQLYESLDEFSLHAVEVTAHVACNIGVPDSSSNVIGSLRNAACMHGICSGHQVDVFSCHPAMGMSGTS
jgi:hypothetical protein